MTESSFAQDLSEDTIIAYVAGAASDEAARRVESAVPTDAELEAKLAILRGLIPRWDAPTADAVKATVPGGEARRQTERSGGRTAPGTTDAGETASSDTIRLESGHETVAVEQTEAADVRCRRPESGVPSEGSITHLFPALRRGDPLADQRIWEQYFQQLARFARQRLAPGLRRTADEEDIALGALNDFFSGIQQGRFPQLSDREDLWRLLVTLARRRVLRHVEHEQAAKRGGGDVRGESAFGPADASEASGGIDGVAEDAGGLRCPVLTADEAAAVLDLQEHLLARLTDDLQQIARLKLDGFTNVEIGRRISRSEALVRLKLQRIQKLWSECRV